MAVRRTSSPYPKDRQNTYSVNTLQEGVSKDVKGHVTPALDPAVHHPIARISKRQILLVDTELLATNGKADSW